MLNASHTTYTSGRRDVGTFTWVETRVGRFRGRTSSGDGLPNLQLLASGVVAPSTPTADHASCL